MSVAVLEVTYYASFIMFLRPFAPLNR